MSKAIDTAIILAAGMGKRLGDAAGNRPKGFLQLGRTTIIEESVAKLAEFGVRRVVLVTGHLAEQYGLLFGGRRDVLTVRNERYADSGSMYSLYCARNEVRGDFLLLESDLVYEKRALDTVLRASGADCVLLSGKTGSGDEVYVETRGDRVWRLSKKREELAGVGGELVGISRISSTLFAMMLEEADRLFKRSLNVEYESGCLSAVAVRTPVGFAKVDDLQWAEIDDEAHLARAKSLVYPNIRRNDELYFPRKEKHEDQT
jgi:2-aminoethylphosphonate-pyruvate transaminase